MYKLPVILFLTIALAVATARPAQAAPKAQAFYGMRCDETTCRLQIDLQVSEDEVPDDEVWLEFMRTSISQLPGAVGFAIGDKITFSLPNAKLNLTGAEVYVMTDGSGNVTNLYGSGMLPATPESLYGEIAVATPVRIEFGYQLGSELEHLGPTLDATQHYWYFTIASEAHLSMAGEPSVTLSVLPGQSLQIVANADRSQIWFDGQVTVHMDDDPSDLYTMLNDTEVTTDTAEALFAQHTTMITVQGQTGSASDPQFEVSASRRGVGFPLALQGTARISPEGLLVSASVATDLVLRPVVDAQVTAQVYAPFTEITELSASVEASVNAPMFGVEKEMAWAFGPHQEQMLAYTPE